MDGRRRRYVMHDVYFLDDALGVAIFDTFGAAGVALWMGFIAACKKSHIEGSFRYGSDTEALSTMGLPGMELVRPDGEPFLLDEFFDLLASHKVIRRRRMSDGSRRTGGDEVAKRRRTRGAHIVCTRWERWQVVAPKRRTDGENRRSDGENTEQLPADAEEMHDEYNANARLETETETETENPAPLALVPEPDLFDDFWSAYPKKVDKRAAERAWKSAMKRGADARLVVSAAASYAAAMVGSSFVKNPATWLNAGSYDNAPAPAANGVSYDVPPTRYV